MTFLARKYLRLCWREGWGLSRCFKLILEYYTYFSRMVKIIIRILQPFLCFSFISIYLFIFLTSWIFILLLVFSLLRYSLLVTALLCLVTPPKNTEEERKLIENGTPESTIRLKKYSSKKFFWNGWMVGNNNPVLEPCVRCCVYTSVSASLGHCYRWFSCNLGRRK